MTIKACLYLRGLEISKAEAQVAPGSAVHVAPPATQMSFRHCCVGAQEFLGKHAEAMEHNDKLLAADEASQTFKICPRNTNNGIINIFHRAGFPLFYQRELVEEVYSQHQEQMWGLPGGGRGGAGDRRRAVHHGGQAQRSRGPACGRRRQRPQGRAVTSQFPGLTTNLTVPLTSCCEF